MKLTRKSYKDAAMSIQEFCEQHDIEIEIEECDPNYYQTPHFIVTLKGWFSNLRYVSDACYEIKETGETEKKAMLNVIQRISSRTIYKNFNREYNYNSKAVFPYEDTYDKKVEVPPIKLAWNPEE